MADSADGQDSATSRDRRRLGAGAAVAVLLLALAVTVVVGIVRGQSAPVERVVVDESPSATAAAASSIYVHVSGAVSSPGLFVLPDGSRVFDAVAAAGGFAEEADEASVNLARVIADGEQLYVPQRGESPPPVGDAPGAGLVDLNTADAAALDTLPRIGPAMAERILQWREANGRFTSVEDLLAVPGIGDKMLETLRPLVTV